MSYAFDQHTHYQPSILDVRPSFHQLIVIGNGFDLECGLPSSFADFIRARNNFFAEEQHTTEDVCFTRTIWDDILREDQDGNWCDIEGSIARWVMPRIGPVTLSKTPLERCLSKLIESRHLRGQAFDTTKAEEAVALQLLNRFSSDSGEWTQERLLEISLKDLHVLEKDFSSYLKNAIGRCPSSKDRVSRLGCELLASERPSSEEYDVEDSILSFNYTRAVKQFQVESHGARHDVNYVNIHGITDGEIIFGIDGTNCLNNTGALPFTKTYRLMSLGLPDTATIVQPPTLGFDGTRLIKFYGHSLGDADYSYFQALFDTVKLYESSAKLIFFYRAHGDTDTNAAKKDMMQKVVRLLNSYGATLDNKDHGKNLIHKLQLEGRLSVKELPDTYRRV